MQKQDEEEVPDVKRETWNAEHLVEQSSSEGSDETVRKVLRGDETKGDADDRDVAGTVDSRETPQGSEENKHQAEVKKNG